METISEEIDRNSVFLAQIGTERYEVTNRTSADLEEYVLITYTCINISPNLSWSMTITNTKGETTPWSWRQEVPGSDARAGKGWPLPGYATKEEALLFRVQLVENTMRKAQIELDNARVRRDALRSLTWAVSDGR